MSGAIKDNLSGDSSYSSSRNPSDSTSDVNQVVDPALNKIDSSNNGQLPSEQSRFSPINWLGSSYSGADIKVVAHIYGAIDTSAEETNLTDQLQLMEELSDAFSNLNVAELIAALHINNITYSQMLKYLPITENSDTRVVSALYSFVADFSTSGLSTEAKISSMQAAAYSNASLYATLATEYRDRLNVVSEIRKQSSSTLVLGNLQTISVQTFREKEPVKALGCANVKGYTRGQRMIAGSMIFTLFNEHSLAKLCQALGTQKSKYGELDTELSVVLGDQLPPLDLTIVFANEYGSLSRAAIYGVEFISSGITLSIEDLLSEEVIQFVARDIDPMVSQGNIGLSRDQRGMHFNSEGARDTKGTDLLFTSKDSYNAFLDKLKIRRRLVNR